MIIDIKRTSDVNIVAHGLGSKIVGLTSGCFDLLHPLHLHFLRRCAGLCEILIVGVDSDLMVQKYKSKTPEIPENSRTVMVGALDCVQVAFTMHDLTDFTKAARLFRPTYIFKNKAQLYGKSIEGSKYAKEVAIIPDIAEVTSTTELVKKIRKKRS